MELTPAYIAMYCDGGAQRFNPMSVPGMAFWHRYNTDITVTGLGVSQWKDQSGNNRHLLQGTDANRPAKNPNGTILFDGIAHFLSAGAFVLAQPTTFFIALKQVSWTLNDYIWDGNTLNNTRLMQSAATPNLAFDTGGVGLIQLGGPAIGSYGVISIVHNGAGSSGQIDQGAPVAGNAGVTNADGFMVGARGAGLAGFSNIEVKEILGYNGALSAAVRNQIAAYMAGL